MPTLENDRPEFRRLNSPRLRPKRVSVSLEAEKTRLLDALLHSDCPVFLDTNILIWSFGLNEQASAAWQKWLQRLQTRLVIPAWVVHEYNQHSDKPEVFAPYKALPKKLQVVLDEVRDCTARALDGTAALALGYSNKIDLESKLAEASTLIVNIAKAVSKNDKGHRTDLLKFYEELLNLRSTTADIHELSHSANLVFDARSAQRISPGGEDADKALNRCGDLIIWQEILQYCSEMGQGEALFVSNDVKRDWCYKPVNVILDNGKEIPWSIDAAKDLRLPNPELLLEFQRHTGGDGITFATIEQVTEMLGSTAHNSLEVAEFSQLAQATRSNRTPTDSVVDWISSSKDLYNEGLRGVAYWQFSPGEVDTEEFEAWCRKKLKDTKIPFDKVDWGDVFVALYL
ncbi:PIN domain-containing protein [Pseudomonas prosekii]|uniref:PIN domain-containing protein n=1 Tax=Pseudomonas prosekii TaxID=1148509 RepID=UPI0011EB6B2A|nr:PIN domain-containing protein [Pseudomonas prosekii]